MSKIDHADNAIDHGVADRDQAIDRAEDNAVDELLGEIVHALPLLGGRGDGPGSRNGRVVSFSNSGNSLRQQRQVRLKGLYMGSFCPAGSVATVATSRRHAIIPAKPEFP